MEMDEDASPDVSDIQKSDIHSMVMMSSGRLSDRRWLSYWRPTLPNMIAKRNIGLNKQQQFTHGDRCLIVSRHLPNHSIQIQSYSHMICCGIYSQDGSLFLSACQDKSIQVFDTSHDGFKEIKYIRIRDVGWTITDTAFSPDGQYAAVSGLSNCVHLCSISDDRNVHEAFMFESRGHSFFIFSLMFSSDNKEILGGASDGHLYVYDRELNKKTLKISASVCSVNTVRFADNSSHILYSGGDDRLCKVWDRRTLREERPLPVGTLAGHSGGITYIDSKGDARFFISNGKDETVKLWDIRQFSDQETMRAVSSYQWDYQWQQVPQTARKMVLKGDSSVMTYQGHCVRHILIRCKFSPEATTGQRYIYTGCATGSIFIYDLLTGMVVRKLKGHCRCVRDVSWHPYKNTIISTSWDGKFLQWTYSENESDVEEKSVLQLDTKQRRFCSRDCLINRHQPAEALTLST